MSRQNTFIIAEAGVNHNGSLKLAKQLVDVAVAAGADAVKFQTFQAEKVVSCFAPKAEYQCRTTGAGESQLEMVRKLELSAEQHAELVGYCRQKGIQFLSTPFDQESVDLLSCRFDLPLLKIPSGEITNGPLLLHIARTGKPVLLSTGMSALGEVETALSVLAFGYTRPEEEPSLAAFQAAYASAEGQQALQQKVTLLHCTTEYPAHFTDVNLRAMDTLRAAFGLPMGYSDHTPGIAVPVAAVARGATVIEKHFTLDRKLPGPDHRASLEPDELKQMVQAVRQVEQALGNGIKAPAPSEIKNMLVARRSLVASRAINKGEQFTLANLAVKRPGTGASPMLYWDCLGKRAVKNYLPDEQI